MLNVQIVYMLTVNVMHSKCPFIDGYGIDIRYLPFNFIMRFATIDPAPRETNIRVSHNDFKHGSFLLATQPPRRNI